MPFAGFDTHKNFCQAIICTKDGTLMKQGRIKTETGSVKEFFSGFDNLEIALEATSNYEYFYDLLESLGHKVVLAHPLKTRMIGEARVKTDKIDARILADLLRGNLLPTSYVPPKEIRELRHLVRYRIFLGRYRAILKNRIKAELRRRNLKYETGGNLYTKKGKKWLRSLGDPLIESCLRIYEIVEGELKEAERRIGEAGERIEEVRLMSTIKGIGVYSALVIYSEIGEIERFQTEEKAFSYAGLVPSIHQSGEERYYGRITKEGSKYLRWILVEAARVHVQWCPESRITKHYEKIRVKRGENIAMVAAARKLLQVIYHMLKNKEEYRIGG